LFMLCSVLVFTGFFFLLYRKILYKKINITKLKINYINLKSNFVTFKKKR